MDEEWIERAIENYQRLERLSAGFPKALAEVEVTVSSPDGLVTVVVGGDGAVKDVLISDDARDVAPRELARSVQSAVRAAGDAAVWARQKLYRETFGEFGELASRTMGLSGELASRTMGLSGELASRTGGLSGDQAGER